MMQKNPATPSAPAGAVRCTEIFDLPPRAPGTPPPEQMLQSLQDTLAAASAGTLVIHRPQRLSEPSPRGDGHFHLAPECFVQISGWTRFRFPEGECQLEAGEVLIVPPQLRHDEWVSASATEPFCNLVIYAEAPTLTCHLAYERSPGKPGISHLETCEAAQHVGRIHQWLFDASLSHSPLWGDVQARALVAATVAGVLQMLNDPDSQPSREPTLIARLRLLIQNQLGDHTLSVKRLAEQSGCTADHLSHQFRQVTGEHLVACINRLRLERADRLLRETTLAVKEVAWACGFSAPSYFIRLFRARHGVPPQAWRSAAGPLVSPAVPPALTPAMPATWTQALNSP